MNQSGIPEYGAPHAPPQQMVAPPQEPARLGPLQRFFGTLFSPGETFADVNRKPTLIAPMIVGIVMALAGTFYFSWRVNPDWDRIFREQFTRQAQRSGQQIPPEQLETQVRVAKTFAKLSPAFVVAIVPLGYLILAGIFALGLMLMQAQTTFKKIISVVAWSSCTVGTVNGLINILTLTVKDEDSLRSIDPTNPGSFTLTNLGVLLDSNASPVVQSVAGSIDIFSIWLMILLSIGFAAISGSKRITSGKAAALVVGLWLFYVLVKVGWAAAFG
jgi:hypothetical protein